MEENQEQNKAKKVLDIYIQKLEKLHKLPDSTNGETYAQILLLQDVIYILRKEFDIKVSA